MGLASMIGAQRGVAVPLGGIKWGESMRLAVGVR